MKKVILILIAVLVAVSAALFLKKQKESVSDLAVAKEYLKSVDIVMAKEEYLSQKKEFLAEVLSSKSANIATKFVARIKNIYVNENDKVKKGDLLVSLDDREILATLSSLKEQKKSLALDVANAKNILERNQKLYDIEAISKEVFDASRAMYQTKLSALKSTDEKINQTKVQLQYLNIRAPFSGVVGSKLFDAGSLAPTGKVILTLNSDDQKLNFMFSQNEKPIAQGQKVFLDNKEIGYISKIYDDAKNTLLVAEVKLYEPLPYANKSYKTIKVEIDRAKACTLPLNALLHKHDEIYVMVYKDEKFSQKKVKVALENTKRAAVSPCPNEPVGVASEAKLSILSTYGKILVDKAQ